MAHGHSPDDFLLVKIIIHLCIVLCCIVEWVWFRVRYMIATFDPIAYECPRGCIIRMSSVDPELGEEEAARAEELKNTANQFFKGIPSIQSS